MCFINCRYKLPLVLIVGVDSENKTRILAQAVIPNEQTDSFTKILKQFVDMCHGIHPEVGLF